MTLPPSSMDPDHNASSSSAETPTSSSASSSDSAQWMKMGQLDFELAFFNDLLQRDPKYVDVLRVQATNLSACGSDEACLDLEQRLIALMPTDGLAHFQMSCTLGRLGRTDDAWRTLQQAVEFGYADLAELSDHPDLEGVRELTEYADLLKSLPGPNPPAAPADESEDDDDPTSV